MFYALGFLPTSSREAMQALRAKHDPTAEVLPPHVGLVFPTPESAGRERLEEHLRQVLSRWEPFAVRLGGLSMTRDHWLFLGLAEGKAEMQALFRDLYVGPLESFRRTDIEFEPHVGLGLFVRDLESYDWNRPESSERDETRYRAARAEAEALRFETEWVRELHWIGIPDAVLEWARGERSSFPPGTRAEALARFPLGEAIV